MFALKAAYDKEEQFIQAQLEQASSPKRRNAQLDRLLVSLQQAAADDDEMARRHLPRRLMLRRRLMLSRPRQL